MDKEKLWAKAVNFHGHVCPGLTIGFKAVELLLDMYGEHFSEDEDIVLVTENDACGVDAFQAILGCTFGKGNLIYLQHGKNAYNIFFRDSGQAVRLYYKGENTEGLDRDAWQKKLFNTDPKELFNIMKPSIPMPEKARLFKSMTCDICGERCREDKIRFQNGQKVCLSCFKEYKR